MERIPEGIKDAENGTTDLIPVCLGVGDAGDGEIGSIAGHRPSGLRNPDGSSTRGAGCGIVRCSEQVKSSGNGIGFRVLEIGVLIDAKPINRVDDGLIRAVYPGSPGIDVTDGNMGKRRVGNDGTDLVDVADEIGGLGTGTGEVFNSDGGVSVEVFASDGNANDDVGEVVAVCSDCGIEGS